MVKWEGQGARRLGQCGMFNVELVEPNDHCLLTIHLRGVKGET
jgi:hypothetical protein